jgi:tetratricopeptide (TPR) repeat protein
LYIKQNFFVPTLKRHLFLSLTFCLCHFISHGQKSKIDSLQRVLRTAKEDTTKVNALNRLSRELYYKGNFDTAIIHAKNGKLLAQKLNFKKGIGASCNEMGNAYYGQGNYNKALENYFAALKIREEIGDKVGIAISNNNIGLVYVNQGNYPEALKKHFTSLKMREELGDRKGIAMSCNNIGIIYFAQGNYPEALKYHSISLKIKEEFGDKRGIAASYFNLGNVYSGQGNYDEALKNHFASLKIEEEMEDKKGIGMSYNNIGLTYTHQGNYFDALRNYFEALKIVEKIGDKEGIAYSCLLIGKAYTDKGEAKKGKEFQEKALTFSKEIGNKEMIKSTYLELVEADSTLASLPLNSLQNRLELAMNALENYKHYVVYKDSLINEETIKKLEREKNQYEFDKKETEAEAERQKKEAVVKAERRKQQIILWSVSGGLLLVILFAGFVFRSLRITKKQKQIIEEQKFQIVESINYSKRIQDSLLPSVKSMQAAIPGLFLFFEPKDIVSGDFYYFKEFEKYTLLACVDCTGHGVPGGFMSTLGSLLLDKIVNNDALSPSEILNKLSAEIIRVLHQQDGGEIQDGMDLSVCLIDKNNKKIEFSGARNGIIIVSDSTAKRYKASALPVGGNYIKKGVPITRNFQTEHIAVNPSDWIYMYTDGFMEQRGGTEGLPMNFTHYENQLIILSTKQTPEEKNKFLHEELANWRGVQERDDDVLIIGFQVA